MEQEIELLERVLFRLGTSDTDEQLENAVIKFLTPVLIKITSPNETVRCKVMEVLTHVNKRLKSRPLVQLPVEQLLVQYNTTDSAFLHNFSIIYITMGFPRLSVEKQTELTPILLNCLEGKTEAHQDKLLMLVLPLLGAIKIPDDPEKRGTLLGLADKPLTKKQLLNLLQDVILLPYGVTSEGEVPPGMSPYSFRRVIANNWKAEELEQMKKGICRFICANVFPDEDILTLLVLASADTRFSVVTPAIAELSKVNSSLDWTDPNLSSPFYSLFLGNASKIVDRKTSGCSARVRQKLLQYLLKSRGKGINTVRGIQIIFEALFGENTNQKCKVLSLQFTENLVKDGPIELITKISKVILTGVTKLIGTESTEPYDVQNHAYCVIAQLARVCPDGFNKDLQSIVSYFGHLVVAPTELHGTIREALVSIAPAFTITIYTPAFRFTHDSNDGTEKFITLNANQKLLLAMLAEHVESKLAIVQNVASVFLTTCFPEYYVPARYLLLLIAGERSSLRESVITSLYGVTRTDHINYSYISSVDVESVQDQDVDKFKLSPEQRRVVLPGFKEMANYVHEQMEKRAASSSQKHVYGKVTLSCTYETYTEILEYLRLCLWFSAGAKTAPGDPKSVEKVNEYIRNALNNSTEIKDYLALAKRILYAKRGQVELQCLYDLLNATPSTLVNDCFDLKDSFMLGLKDVSDLTRILVAQLQGILMAYGNNESEFNAEAKDIITTLPQKTLEHRHGSILTLCHAFQRRIKSLKSQSDFNQEKIQNWAELKKMMALLGALLSEQQALLISAAIKGISLIGSSTILPLPDTSSPAASDAMEVDDSDGSISKASLVSTIFRLLKSAHTKAKLREDAANCLGYLAVGDGKYFAASNLKLFIEIVKLSKDTALNIAIAQGIVLTISGEENIYDESSNTENPFCDDKTFNDFLSSVIGFVSDPNPCSRNSTAIWLLALVKNFSKRTPIVSRKQTLQFAFTELLSDDSEFIQDVASRGLGLVFSLSDQSGQTDLANSLLDQLIGGKRQVNQVNEDTKIFEEGVLGKTPMGGNITTYKELCSLASDLNQPEMIYKFMQLANHNAAWNSKLGAAFGLKSISKAAKEQMQPFLGKIVPRLFRYKYDPTPKIQNSMISIWDSIVSDSKEVVEKYYWEIFDELTSNLTHVEWRVRIACCLAVRDLIKRAAGLRLKFDDRALLVNKMEVDSAEGASQMETDEIDIPEPEVAKLWSQLFRVMDDVHEGTRLAAEGTAKTLSKICVVAASGSGKSAQVVASSILPLILEVGVTHTVPEIRNLSMKTLSELIESSGRMLKNHLHTLVPCLLKATGELEVPKLSYLSTRLGANIEAQEAVDSLRAEAAKQHHSMETLVKCIRHITYESLEKMTPEVVELMRSTVNLGTKIACAHFVCLITVRFNKEMTPLVSKYLSACFNGLKDRNTIVRKYNASAIGHLIGLAKEQSIVRLFAKLTEFYFENQSNKGVPYAVSAINKRHQDILKDYPAHVLPLIFFAMHEEIDEDNRSNVELWKELWLEVSPGDGGIRMNLESIIPMLEKSLDDHSWLIKAQSANSITTIATRLGTNLGQVERERLIACLMANISGRTFQGKERLLQALSSLCKDLKKSESSSYTTIIDAIMKECRKEEPLYRTHALKAVGDILEQLGEDRFEEIYNMIWYLMDKKDLAAVTGDDEDKNLSADERNKRAMIVISLKETVCETLGKAWPNEEKTQDKYQLMFVEQCVRCLQNNTRPVQLSVLVSLGKFLDRLKILEPPNAEQNQEKKQKTEGNESLQKICTDVLSAVVYVAGIPHTGLKKEALNIVLILVKRLIDIKSHTELAMVKKTFDEILITLQKDSAPEIKCRINDIEEKLKSN